MSEAKAPCLGWMYGALPIIMKGERAIKTRVKSLSLVLELGDTMAMILLPSLMNLDFLVYNICTHLLYYHADFKSMGTSCLIYFKAYNSPNCTF